MTDQTWPSLPLEAWRETSTTLHLWTQIVGKVRLRQVEWLNHSWHATLYVTARGLTTSPVPYEERTFQIEFDFLDQVLRIEASDGRRAGFPLESQTVAQFYARLMSALDEIGVRVRIHGRPNEVLDPVPFKQDHAPRAYRRRICAPVLAGARAGGSRVQDLPSPIRGQGQSGALFLGRARPGGHSVLGAYCAGAPRRRS